MAWLNLIVMGKLFAKARQVLIIGRLGVVLLAFATQAGPLITEMRYQASEINYWRSRNLNSLQIEAYVTRNYRFSTSYLNRLQEAFAAGFLVQHNHLLNLTPQLLNPLELRPDWIRLSSQLDETLQALPAVEHLAYQGLMSASLAQDVQVGEGLLERGFMLGSASLHNVYHSLPQGLSNSDFGLSIFRIESVTGRHSSVLHRSSLSATLWPKNSFFQVMAKEHDPQSQITFFHLKEVSEEQAGALPRLRSFHNAVPVNTHGRPIVLSCL
jgi:hypothetical protein